MMSRVGCQEVGGGAVSDQRVRLEMKHQQSAGGGRRWATDSWHCWVTAEWQQRETTFNRMTGAFISQCSQTPECCCSDMQMLRGKLQGVVPQRPTLCCFSLKPDFSAAASLSSLLGPFSSTQSCCSLCVCCLSHYSEEKLSHVKIPGGQPFQRNSYQHIWGTQNIWHQQWCHIQSQWGHSDVTAGQQQLIFTAASDFRLKISVRLNTKHM